MIFNLTRSHDFQRDASQQAIARWENEGGALASIPGQDGKDGAERLSTGSSRPIEIARDSHAVVVRQPESQQ